VDRRGRLAAPLGFRADEVRRRPRRSATRLAGTVKLRLATFSFSGRYKLCVEPSTGARTCKTFPLIRRSGRWVSEVRWYRQFPNRGTGVYTVTWFYGGTRLGPPLTFAVADS
jgi:hypothetical protein